MPAYIRLRGVKNADIPLYARVAIGNFASLKVLQRCGFVVFGEERSLAEARACETCEPLLRLDAPSLDTETQ